LGFDGEDLKSFDKSKHEFFQAGHCQFGFTRTVIYTGIDSSNDKVWRSPGEYRVIHENYDDETLDNDIALLKSFEPAPMTGLFGVLLGSSMSFLIPEFIAITNLPPNDHNLYKHVKVKIQGFGTTSTDSGVSQFLMYTTSRIKTNSEVE
jgi:hypothetical protein